MNDYTSRTGNKIFFQITAVLLFLSAAAACAHASVALLLEEPYGVLGAFNPTGHAAVYLNHICAETPIVLRPCHNGEYGVVISRYHKMDGYDWIAMPLVAYLYSVDKVNEIPSSVDKKQVAALQNAYRKEYLLDLAPDKRGGGPPKGEWTELVGESYIRKMYGFQVDSTPEQDQRFIAIFNDHKNVGHYNLLFHNCADFSRVVLDIYLPHAIHRNFIADLGLMTPKQVARSLVKYGRKHPEIGMTVFVIPQVTGSVHRSHSVDGIIEMLVKSKKYLLPMTILSPEVTGGAVVAYLADGRLNLPKDVPIFNIKAEKDTNQPKSAASTSRVPLEPTSNPATAATSPKEDRL